MIVSNQLGATVHSLDTVFIRVIAAWFQRETQPKADYNFRL